MARHTKEQSHQLRTALRRFMQFKDYSVNEWARLAGISEGTLRNFLAGTSETLTHATLAALARAVRQPIGAIIGEIPLQGYTDTILVIYEVDALKVSDSAWMSVDNQFEISLPMDLRFPNVKRFAAVIRDESAHEFYRSGSIVVCVDYIDIGRTPTDGDRVLVVEQEYKDTPKQIQDLELGRYRVTIRELNTQPDAIWLTFPASYRKFKHNSLPMVQLTGGLEKDEISGGYHHYVFGTEMTLVTSIRGLVIAAYSLEEYRI